MDDLGARLAGALTDGDADELLEVGGALWDADRTDDAERAFRGGMGLGSGDSAISLGALLASQGRLDEGAAALRWALDAGATGAWVVLGDVYEVGTDRSEAMRCYDRGARAGEVEARLALAFALREEWAFDAALVEAEQAAADGSATASGVVACWRWCTSHDPALEPLLRKWQGDFPAARSDLGKLLRLAGRVQEARRVFEVGVKLGESESMLPLGNLYWDDLDDLDAAEAVYRLGIAADDRNCYLNLGNLLHERGDVDGAEEQYRLGAAAGDALAARALDDLLDDAD